MTRNAIGNENTPLLPANTQPCPTTPTRSGRRPLLSANPTPSSQFSTPRKRKSTPQKELPTLARKQWPRIGKRIPPEDIKAAIKQIFGYEPRSWQLKLAEKVLEGHDAIGLAGTGAGKSLVFAILAVAAEMAEFQGLVLVICPLKSPFSRLEDSMASIPSDFRARKKSSSCPVRKRAAPYMLCCA